MSKLLRTMRRYIVAKQVDGVRMYMGSDMTFKTQLSQAHAFTKNKITDPDVIFLTPYDLFSELQAEIRHHELERDKHAEIVNKLNFLKIVG